MIQFDPSSYKGGDIGFSCKTLDVYKKALTFLLDDLMLDYYYDREDFLLNDTTVDINLILTYNSLSDKKHYLHYGLECHYDGSNGSVYNIPIKQINESNYKEVILKHFGLGCVSDSYIIDVYDYI